MFGTVIVEDAGGGGQPGTLRFSLASYAVSEGAGTATITVQRINGDDGAVSVQYSATAGTATAGQDFTPASGTLSWADKDNGNKTFTVAINDDTAVEPSETVLLALSNPTGGATLDAALKSATLTIQDNDTGGGAAAGQRPSNLKATAPLDQRDRPHLDRQLEQRDRLLRSSAGRSAAPTRSSPPSAPTSRAPPSPVSTRGRSPSSGSAPPALPAIFSAYSAEVGAATLANPGTCVADANTLCVTNNRFKVEVAWRSGRRPRPGVRGAAPLGARLRALLLLRRPATSRC